MITQNLGEFENLRKPSGARNKLRWAMYDKGRLIKPLPGIPSAFCFDYGVVLLREMLEGIQIFLLAPYRASYSS